jgi:hypothetical protein
MWQALRSGADEAHPHFYTDMVRARNVTIARSPRDIRLKIRNKASLYRTLFLEYLFMWTIQPKPNT